MTTNDTLDSPISKQSAAKCFFGAASREKLRQLLAAARPVSIDQDDSKQTDDVKYDWRRPRCFSADQSAKIDGFTKKLAATIARKFTALCHIDFDVTIAAVTEHFANEILSQIPASEQNSYYLAFGADKTHPCGVIKIPAHTAIVWTTQLLGDSHTEKDSGRDLSKLEESLLLDIASSVVDAIFSSNSGLNFHPAEAVVKGHLPIEVPPTKEICKITFNVSKAAPAGDKQAVEAHILIQCDKLEPVVGKTTQAEVKLSADDVSKTILGHLQEMPISITAQLARTSLTFEEAMNLQVDDVLLLDKKTSEPVELFIEGRTIFRGRPAKSEGKQAVIITEKIADGKNVRK